MLFSAAEIMRPQRLFDKPLKGIVVDNEDPLKIGRVKCTVQPFLVGDTASLPWIIQKSGTGLGGTSDDSAFAVPVVGSEVCVEFPFGIYMPVYSGFWQSQATHQTHFDEDYPNTYGFKDATGTYWRINKTKLHTEFRHASGSYIQFDKDGNVFEHTVKDRTETIDGNRTVTVKGNETYTVEGNRVGNIQGTETFTYDQTRDVTVTQLDSLTAPAGIVIEGDTAQEGNYSATLEVSDGVRSMSADRLIYNGHVHIHGVPTTTPPTSKQ
ncbi:hypothetical protein GR7B_00144 [Vibrio phage vB_VcorM_GR7B]|nr:hypothetical protein GR7B_00144 [Vibrio phage vB_VcorM_GR7B]